MLYGKKKCRKSRVCAYSVEALTALFSVNSQSATTTSTVNAAHLEVLDGDDAQSAAAVDDADSHSLWQW